MPTTIKATPPESPGKTNPTGRAPVTWRVIDGGKESGSQGSTPEPLEGLSPIFEWTVAVVVIALVAAVLILDRAIPAVAN